MVFLNLYTRSYSLLRFVGHIVRFLHIEGYGGPRTLREV